MAPPEQCVYAGEGCENPVATKNGRRMGNMCWAHLRRRKRIEQGKTGLSMADPVRPYRLSRWEHLARMAVDYAEVEALDSERHERAKRLLILAAIAYAKKRPKRRSRNLSSR